MKKVLSFVFMALTVLLLSAPLGGVAEAARVAVVPIQIDDQKVARSGDFNGYYWDLKGLDNKDKKTKTIWTALNVSF